MSLDGHPLIATVDRVNAVPPMRGSLPIDTQAMIVGVDRNGSPVVIPVGTGYDGAELRGVSDSSGVGIAVGTGGPSAGNPGFVTAGGGGGSVTYSEAWRVNGADDTFNRADGPITSGGNWNALCSYLIKDQRAYAQAGPEPVWQSEVYFPVSGSIITYVSTPTNNPPQSWLWRITATGSGGISDCYGEALLFTLLGDSNTYLRFRLLFDSVLSTSSTINLGIAHADIFNTVNLAVLTWQMTLSGSAQVEFIGESYNHQF